MTDSQNELSPEHQVEAARKAFEQEFERFARFAGDPNGLAGLSLEQAVGEERFLADLPRELADESSRTLADDSAPGAAWGNPPILLTCGGPLPDDFDRFGY